VTTPLPRRTIARRGDERQATAPTCSFTRSSADSLYASVRALNCLQNSIMLTPSGPSAWPICGDGFAVPARQRSLAMPFSADIAGAAAEAHSHSHSHIHSHTQPVSRDRSAAQPSQRHTHNLRPVELAFVNHTGRVS
jgi:hypothetical protein